MVDDHFVHGLYMPPEESHRRGPVILAVVVILVLGALGALYWGKVITFPFSFSTSEQGQAPQKAPPPTLEQKQALLNSGTNGNSESSNSPAPAQAAKEALLESNTKATGASSPQISSDEKKRLLGAQ